MRCARCGHPAGESVWAGEHAHVIGPGLGQVSEEAQEALWLARERGEVRTIYDTEPWTPCDRECCHGIDPGARIKPNPIEMGGPRPASASWRTVAERDGEMVCLRCWSARRA